MGKHSANKVRREKKAQKLNTKVLAVLAIIIIMIIIIKVNLDKKNKNSENILESEIANIVNNTFSSLKISKIDDVQKHLNYIELISGLDEMVYKNGESELEKNLFKTISWNTTDVKIDGENAIATVEFTNKNYKNVITKWMKTIVDEKTMGQDITEDLILEKLNETIESETETKTLTKNVQLEKQNNEWKIKVNNELINLIYPGLDSVIEALNQNA